MADALALRFINELQHHLLRFVPSPTSIDLHERIAVVAAACEGLSESSRRVSWCCYVAHDALLRDLQTACPENPPEQRATLRAEELAGLDAALARIEELYRVARVELLLGEDMLGAEQLQARDFQKILATTAGLRALCGYARAYLLGTQSAAETVGHVFFEFLEPRVGRDTLVEIAERLVKVDEQ